MGKELLSGNIVMFDLSVDTKEQVIQKISEAMEKDGRLFDREGYVKDVMLREKTASTAVGFMTATPHAKSVHVKEASLAFSRLEHSINWDGQEDVNIVFQIAVPSPGQGDRHLEIISSLFRKLVYDEFREKLLNAATKEEVLEILGDFRS